MRRMLPWVLLAISLLVNAGFVFGALHAQRHAERLSFHPEARSEAVAERLALTEAQRAAMERLRLRLYEQREAERASRSESGGGFFDRLLPELASPDYDRAAIEALLSEHSEQRKERWIEMGEEVHGFLRELAPEQRETLLSLTREEHGNFLRGLFFFRPAPSAGQAGGD